MESLIPFLQGTYTPYHCPAAYPASFPTTGHPPTPRLEPFPDQAKYSGIGHPVLDELSRPRVAHVIEEATDVRIEHPVHLLPLQSNHERIERLMRTAARTEPVGEALEVDLINLIEDRHHGLLDDFVFQCRDAQRTLPPIGLRYIDSP